MKADKKIKKLVEDLGLSEVGVNIIGLKAKLYAKSADLINASMLSHEEIAPFFADNSRIQFSIGHEEPDSLSTHQSYLNYVGALLKVAL